jgi:hypothetical protein
MNILLGSNVKLGREDIFKPTIGNYGLHKINTDNGFVLNFSISKNLSIKSTTFSYNIHKFTNISFKLTIF